MGVCSRSILDAFESAGTCLAGQDFCEGACVDVARDRLHCGGCGIACADDWACIRGACEPCPSGTSACSGACVDTSSNSLHCGACNNGCGDGEVCGDGNCGLGCPEGQALCGSGCFDLSRSAAHCGACDVSCAESQECVSGACGVTCTGMLVDGVKDSWGNGWDGLERAPAPFAAALAACSAVGARLPTVNELYRVRAQGNESNAIGSGSTNNPLWAAVRFGAGEQYAVRLSDGETSSADTANDALAYRCICAGEGNGFGAGRCAGPEATAEGPCFDIGAGYNMDARDRVALPKAAAASECAHVQAHVASVQDYTLAFDLGMAPSTEVVWTADDVPNPVTLLWQAAPMGDEDLSSSGAQLARPFRCVGSRAEGTASAVVGGFSGPNSPLVAGEVDEVASSYLGAIDTCWVRGGHVPTRSELVELVGQGLPGGSGTNVWTGDEAMRVFYFDTVFGSDVLYHNAARWDSAAYPADGYPTIVAIGSGASTLPYRCVHYPLDEAFDPAGLPCAGAACLELAGSGQAGVVPTLYFDEQERQPKSWPDAVLECAGLGGRLPLSRDLRAALRGGLVGADISVWSSDIMRYVFVNDESQNFVGAAAVRLPSAANPQAAAVPTRMTSPLPFRCMWTNELR